MPSMMIALSPKTLRKLSLPWLLKPSMWVSMRLWISGGGLLVTVILLEVQRADVLGTIQAYRDWHQRAYHVDLRSKLLPYLRMLTTYLSFLRQRRVALVHGVRHSCDLGYRSVLMAMQRLRTNLIYLPIISRPQEGPMPWKELLVTSRICGGALRSSRSGVVAPPRKTLMCFCVAVPK